MVYQVAIIGSGISGIAAAVLLQKQLAAKGLTAEVEYTIYERCPEVGGTWHLNVYPGAACDIPSHFYSYSFDPNPDWTRKYSPQQEILAYVKRVSAKFGVTPHVRLNTTVASAVWDEARAGYTLTLTETHTGTGACGAGAVSTAAATGTPATELVFAHFVIAGVGALCTPLLPEIPGQSEFRGKAWHSARWDMNADITGLDVGVIGTGCSAVQIVPAIAPAAKSVTLYQRTAAWVTERQDFAYPAWARFLFRYVPLVMGLYRWSLIGTSELRYFMFVKPVALLKRLPTLAATMWRNRQISKSVEAAKPGLKAALTPKYPIGCKRIVISDDYYTALARPNVHLVASPFRMTSFGCVSEQPPVGEPGLGTEHKHDVIVYSTGFDLTASTANVDLYGQGGVSLRQQWAGNPSAYLGVTVPNFPNLFFCMGPNTGLGHSSMIAMIECQAKYAAQCIVGVVAAKQACITVKEKPFVEYNDQLMRRLAGCVWASCQSWYNQGGGKNVSLWPGTVTEYWWVTRTPNLAHYVVRGAEVVPGAAAGGAKL